MMLNMTKCLAGAAALCAFAVLPAAAQGLDEPFQASFKQALAGKTVAYIPVAMNFDLTEGWFAGVKKELEPYGMKVIVRDANWSTNAGAQADL
jgi:ribose transport system substrate-binding protein